MPALFPIRQPAAAAAWFAGAAGQALLASEAASVGEALAERPGQPALWLAPVPPPARGTPRCVHLSVAGDAWGGDVRCAFPLPFCSESLGTVIVQHVGDLPVDAAALLDECARVLVPEGRVWLFALNPLTPYRRHWLGEALRSSEPLGWRRRLRAAGLEPEPVTTGLGPRWHVAEVATRQDGPGFRATWLMRARKRVAGVVPPSPVAALRWQPGLTA